MNDKFDFQAIEKLMNEPENKSCFDCGKFSWLN